MPDAARAAAIRVRPRPGPEPDRRDLLVARSVHVSGTQDDPSSVKCTNELLCGKLRLVVVRLPLVSSEGRHIDEASNTRTLRLLDDVPRALDVHALERDVWR